MRPRRLTDLDRLTLVEILRSLPKWVAVAEADRADEWQRVGALLRRELETRVRRRA